MVVLAKKYSPKVEQELINECINKLYLGRDLVKCKRI